MKNAIILPNPKPHNQKINVVPLSSRPPQSRDEVCFFVSNFFARNFTQDLDERFLEKVTQTSFLASGSRWQIHAQKYLDYSLANEKLSDIKADCKRISKITALDFFGKITQKQMNTLLEQVGEPVWFAALPPTHISNVLFVLGKLFHYNVNKNAKRKLVKFAEGVLPSVAHFAMFSRFYAQTAYFKAIGEYLYDFCDLVKNALELKVEL